MRGAIDLQNSEEDEPSKERGDAKRFGDYDLLEELARGGMGIVYRARQRSLGRVVALKVLLGGTFAGEEGKRRLHAEAAAAGRLQHPNIVAVHDAGVVDGQPFFSMTLDFGAAPFAAGAERWLQLDARTAPGPFTTLSPRQKLTATPYAITAGNLTGPLLAAAQTWLSRSVGLGADSGGVGRRQWRAGGSEPVDGRIVVWSYRRRAMDRQPRPGQETEPAHSCAAHCHGEFEPARLGHWRAPSPACL